MWKIWRNIKKYIDILFLALPYLYEPRDLEKFRFLPLYIWALGLRKISTPELPSRLWDLEKFWAPPLYSLWIFFPHKTINSPDNFTWKLSIVSIITVYNRGIDTRQKSCRQKCYSTYLILRLMFAAILVVVQRTLLHATSAAKFLLVPLDQTHT